MSRALLMIFVATIIAPKAVSATICSSVNSALSRAYISSGTRDIGAASARPKSTTSCSRESSVSSSGLSPESMRMRRKNVEQMRQSVSAEIACEKMVVRRSPRKGWTVSRRSYHHMSAS